MCKIKPKEPNREQDHPHFNNSADKKAFDRVFKHMLCPTNESGFNADRKF